MSLRDDIIKFAGGLGLKSVIAVLTAKDANGDPQIVSLADLVGGGDASAANQVLQTNLLTTIANASLPDKETPSMLYRVKAGQSFTGAIAGDPILGILTIDTVTNAFVSENPIWYNGRSKLAIANADVDTSKLEIIAANSLTASELSTLTLAISSVQIGEVQASPTAYTVLDRLKTIATTLSGVLSIKNSPLTSDTPTSVGSLATTQTLIAANANRRSLTIFNNSTAILYVCFGATATQAGAKVPIGAGGFYEMPNPIYTGIISGIWASSNGNASIYEGV